MKKNKVWENGKINMVFKRCSAEIVFGNERQCFLGMAVPLFAHTAQALATGRYPRLSGLKTYGNALNLVINDPQHYVDYNLMTLGD
jgi:hypothetical protein